jgi:hypothetical protein
LWQRAENHAGARKKIRELVNDCATGRVVKQALNAAGLLSSETITAVEHFFRFS